MSFANRISRAALLGIGAATIAPAALAQVEARSMRSFTQAFVDSAGAGQGSIHLPTAGGEGLMVGVLVDDKDGRKYVLEAELTTWMPSLFGPSTRVAFGGIYGHLLQHSGQGVLQDAQPEFAGRVEGTWRLEQDLTGTYMAYVYERSSAGVESVTGLVEGSFRVHEADGAMPAPQRPDLAAHRRGKGVSDRRPSKSTLGDAGAEKLPGAAGGKQRGSDLAGARRFAGAAPSDREKEPSVLAQLDLVQPRDFADARSSGSGTDPIFEDARRKQRAQRPRELGDARSDSSSGTVGRDALSQASTGPQAKKRPLLGDARSNAPARIPRGLSDVASSGASGSTGAVKDAWQSAGSAALGTPLPDFGRAGSGGQKVVWPVLMGAFRAKYKLVD